MTENYKEIAVTGINGFVGEHLAEHLKASGMKVLGIGREQNPTEEVAPYLDSYQQSDLMNSQSAEGLDLSNTHGIIHLAGLASVAESFDKPDLYIKGNAEITNNVLLAASKHGIKGRIVVISSGALYDGSQKMPITEDSKIAENSPYAVGKMRAEQVAIDHKSKGLDVVIARPFNHIGPHQKPGFLLPDLYEQLLQAQENETNEIVVGNLNTRRDYTDVRDIVRAYVTLLEADKLQFDIYNICSGVSLSGLEVLEELKRCLNLEDIKVIIDPTKVRPTDIQEITGSAERLKKETGWSPESTALNAIRDFVKSK